MKSINQVIGICYSPAGSTRSVVEFITKKTAEKLGIGYQLFSYTLPKERAQRFKFTESELVIWGTPVNAGRIPNKTLEYVKNAFVGSNTPAIPVVTFGNRNYDNALAELAGIMKDNGCIPIGGAAVVSRHVFSKKLAAGRPCEKDFAEAEKFCNAVAGFFCKSTAEIFCNSLAPKKCHLPDDISLELPGEEKPVKYYTPLKANGEPAIFLKAKPVVNIADCVGCGTCASLCPNGSIRMNTPSASCARPYAFPAFEGICTKCHTCILNCPNGAISITDPDFLSHVEMLEKNYAEPQKSSFFIAT